MIARRVLTVLAAVLVAMVLCAALDVHDAATRMVISFLVGVIVAIVAEDMV